MPRLVARAFLLLLVAATILPTRVLAKEERLIGWLGEVARPLHGSGAPGGDKPTGEAAELAQLGYWLEPVSWYPRAFHLHNFMSPQEADRILEIARPRCVYFNSRSTTGNLTDVTGFVHPQGSSIDRDRLRHRREQGGPDTHQRADVPQPRQVGHRDQGGGTPRGHHAVTRVPRRRHADLKVRTRTKIRRPSRRRRTGLRVWETTRRRGWPQGRHRAPLPLRRRGRRGDGVSRQRVDDAGAEDVGGWAKVERMRRGDKFIRISVWANQLPSYFFFFRAT